MFQIGEYVACGNKGVCIVDDIKRMDISGGKQEEDYYILKSVYKAGSTMYVQVDQDHMRIRPILSHDQADAFVQTIKQIQPIPIVSEKKLEDDYKMAVRSNDVRTLVSLIKTIYERKQDRLKAGKKETALDMKYFRIASDYLLGELAVSLDMEMEDVVDYITREGWTVS